MADTSLGKGRARGLGPLFAALGGLFAAVVWSNYSYLFAFFGSPMARTPDFEIPVPPASVTVGVHAAIGVYCAVLAAWSLRSRPRSSGAVATISIIGAIVTVLGLLVYLYLASMLQKASISG